MSGPAEALQERARAALSGFVAVEMDDDGALRFEYGGALCSLRAVTLADGLDVLSITAVLAWDRTLKPALHKRVAERNASLQFGSIDVITRGKLADVLLRYTFPATGLADAPLATMLLLVLSGVEDARRGLLG
ncbi:YbjN domain-containing protein [Prescottella sp. R16]|uniref:YbjN domain-containing protein n=1 Tax=Prescottella sp. R16 TaxID=3064529 RepID=UPI00272DF255|nr:YbjN domain-containing protein [Prescottella sp. R16]